MFLRIVLMLVLVIVLVIVIVIDKIVDFSITITALLITRTAALSTNRFKECKAVAYLSVIQPG